MTPANLDCDVAVVGAAPSGCAIAWGLAPFCRVLLLEAEVKVRPRVGESLPPVAGPLLRALGLEAALALDGQLPSYGNSAAWGGGAPHDTEFLFAPYGAGWRIDRARFDRRMLEMAQARGAKLLRPARVTSVLQRERGRGWQLRARTPEGETELHCSVVVDATGRRAAVARLGRLATRHSFDRLVACWQSLPARGGKDDSATTVEAVRDGWWYTMAVPSGARVVAIHTDSDLPGFATLRGAGGFAKALAATDLVRTKLATVSSCPAPRVLDARSSRLEPAAGAGWIAVGDAAAAYDPLASHGVRHALASGRHGAEAILRWLGGEASAMAAFAEAERHAHERYRADLAAVYGLERRFKGSPFWRRRHAQDGSRP